MIKNYKSVSGTVAIFLFCAAFLVQPVTFAAPSTTSPVGVVNYQQLINQHPDMAQAQAAYDAAVKQAQDDFNAKSANMNDNDKKAYFEQLQQGLQQKQQDLLNAIKDKINVAVKAVADAKGLTIIVDKAAAVYGGQDITDEVLKKITGK